MLCEKFVLIKVVLAHGELQERTRFLSMTGPTMRFGGVGKEGGTDMGEEVKQVYEVVERIDVLDVSVGRERRSG